MGSAGSVEEVEARERPPRPVGNGRIKRSAKGGSQSFVDPSEPVRKDGIDASRLARVVLCTFERVELCHRTEAPEGKRIASGGHLRARCAQLREHSLAFGSREQGQARHHAALSASRRGAREDRPFQLLADCSLFGDGRAVRLCPRCGNRPLQFTQFLTTLNPFRIVCVKCDARLRATFPAYVGTLLHVILGIGIVLFVTSFVVPWYWRGAVYRVAP